jgi:hypothetical protein
MQGGEPVHLVCWMTVYRCQLEHVFPDIRELERR